jgi:diguanylate cyclase (GGDEF)-like protein/PAS domain S-box-containing protein
LDLLDLLAFGGCALCGYMLLRLWRNRRAPGAPACFALFLVVAGYIAATLRADPSLPTVRLTSVLVPMIAPLALVVLVDYLGLRIPRWQLLRGLLVAGAGLLGLVVVATDRDGLLSAIAAEDDLTRRTELILAARQTQLAPSTWLSYGATLISLAIAVWQLVRSPARRREMLIFIAVPGLVTAADAAYFLTGFTVAGVLPTPFAVLGGVVALALALYRSPMFDLRPIARSVLVDGIRDGMFAVDTRQRVVDCNRAASELLGEPRNAILGRSVQAALPRELRAMLQSPGHLRTELCVHMPDAARWLEVDVTPLNVKQRHAGHLLVVRDIGERIAAQQALHESRAALEAANTRLMEQSVTDPLTGLKNRRFLFARLEQELDRHRRDGKSLGLVLVDVDHFKAVNDTHGHPAGDEALVQVADALAGSVRGCDLVARLGGEEFAVIAVDVDLDGLVVLAERIRTALARVPIARHTQQPMMLTASLGAVCAEPTGVDAEHLFVAADRYLYRAKHTGRNRVVAAALSASRPRRSA